MQALHVYVIRMASQVSAHGKISKISLELSWDKATFTVCMTLQPTSCFLQPWSRMVHYRPAQAIYVHSRLEHDIEFICFCVDFYVVHKSLPQLLLFLPILHMHFNITQNRIIKSSHLIKYIVFTILRKQKIFLTKSQTTCIDFHY